MIFFNLTDEILMRINLIESELNSRNSTELKNISDPAMGISKKL
jgi:hypothetical protein